MNQGNCFVVGMLGLPEQELRLVKSMLRMTASRTQGCYSLHEGADIANCDVVIVNADDPGAMAQWSTLSRQEHAPLPVLVTSTALVYSSENYFLRPFSPTKLLALLDKLALEIRVKEPDQQIFAGKGHSAGEPAGRMTGMPFQSRRALVVDDSPTVRKQLEIELKASNIFVDSAETGEQGLDLAEQNAYDIIFLDVVLPGADGYQVCKSIKKNPATKLTPVVMLTSKSSPFDRVRGSLAGCDTYLTKPVDYEKFKQVLEEYKVYATAA
ncbi:MAG TPA: response regulator [Gallionellaceae bacterium]|nr:response regulator [Gallionellaceae bacterium]